VSVVIDFYLLRNHNVKYGNLVRLARWLNIEVGPIYPPRVDLARRVHMAILEQKEQDNGPETRRMFTV
jgi:hypothetical protein